MIKPIKFQGSQPRPSKCFQLPFMCAFALLMLGACSRSNFDSEFRRLDHDGLRRSYLIHLPENYDPESLTPLVLAFHGGTGSAKNIEEQSGLTELSEEKGFILVSPDGHKNTWNAGNCCGRAKNRSVDDVGFVSALLDELKSEYAIDPDRVYATGMSNGAMMCYRLACEMSHEFAAIAPVAASMVHHPCSFEQPVSIIHFHSTQDFQIPWNGGVGDGVSSHYNAPGDSVLNAWASFASCSSFRDSTWPSGLYFWERTTCQDSTSYQLYLSSDGGHSWPQGTRPRRNADEPSDQIDANETMWQFFQDHPKRI